jgi:hypothetical protein
MKQTAMQLLLKEVTEARDISVDVNFRSALDFVRDTIEWDYLEKEKEQIIDANIAGMEFIPVDPNKHQEDSEQYYNGTFKTNEK